MVPWFRESVVPWFHRLRMVFGPFWGLGTGFGPFWVLRAWIQPILGSFWGSGTGFGLNLVHFRSILGVQGLDLAHFGC